MNDFQNNSNGQIEKDKRFFINVLLKTGVFLILIGTIWFFREEIINFLPLPGNSKVVVSQIDNNIYAKNEDFEYLQLTDDFYIKDYEHLMNAYYTIVNSGMDTFVMKCDETYDNCVENLEELANDNVTLSYINSFVNTYNSYSTIETSFDDFGKIEITINKAYTKEQVKELEDEVKRIINLKTDPNHSLRDNILSIHDYIIERTTYDVDKSLNQQSDFDSSSAVGPLFQGKAICGGYTDAMALFLDYYNITNYKVINENHIWNALKLDGKWFHLDLTWNDPIMDDGSEIIDHTFFLINYKELMKLQNHQHFYKVETFSEVSK